MKGKSQEELVREEQRVLDSLIRDMDNTLLKLDKRLTYGKLQAKKAREACLPDAYGMLVSAEHDKLEVRQRMRELYNGKDELYQTHLILNMEDKYGREKKDLKVGLHTYMNGHRIFIISWKMPLCRHYLLDNTAEVYDEEIEGHKTRYKLDLKRQVNIFFDKVKSVIQSFPVLDEEAEQIIADEFLQELLNRRSGQEFKNIVFSIQKKQGEIIQTPFKQNLIVQGCAGSGKSMIMLHRLPILLFDNPKDLNRNSLYIITPSKTYIQMANNMRMDLEIEDLKMGTLKQYYDYVLGKYGVEEDAYGTVKTHIKLETYNSKYVYSESCINDIKNEIEVAIEKGKIDYQKGYMLLNLTEKKLLKKPTIPTEIIRSEIVKIQTLINENENSLRSYHRHVVKLIDQLDEFARMLEVRKIAVNRGINKGISEAEKLIADKEKELKKYHNLDKDDVKYKNRMNSIRAAQVRIGKLREVLREVSLNDAYFEDLKRNAADIRKKLSEVNGIKRERMEMSLEDQYQMISDKEELSNSCKGILERIKALDDPYGEYTEKITSGYEKVEQCYVGVREDKSLYLPLDYLKKLMITTKYFDDVVETMVDKIYHSIMKKLGQEPDDKGKLNVPECAPYLYLQIMYLFTGAPNEAKESLITIDEAQNIEPEELKLIKAVNGNNLVFNLFGDVKQHVEGSKGIDDWKQIAGIADFKEDNMQENYRNARQITEFCNKRFNLKMRAINLDGSGVHELENEKEFDDVLVELFQKPKKSGLSCIIIRNREEAESLLERARMYVSRINDMTGEIAELQKNKWNLMTVEQAKGLEFETVLALTGRMSENEKYITYTRALDELYVYDDKIPLREKLVEDKTDITTEKKIEEKTIRKKREKRSSKQKKADEKAGKELKDFFAEKGLEINDDRKKSGHLWVIGSENEIGMVVNEAIELYNITGSYGCGKASGYRKAWFTKSKK